eukprot:TRINITY_DN10190_c0_g1_i1.p1 TRINITY_DN10190_c0_g1~~TRINITY_DN10190_c0_g1_i1.p1  ORF type:complete len:105 (+),score=13.47 TRINITY_DN10190_c0_g1_i1:50-364(+)
MMANVLVVQRQKLLAAIRALQPALTHMALDPTNAVEEHRKGQCRLADPILTDCDGVSKFFNHASSFWRRGQRQHEVMAVERVHFVVIKTYASSSVWHQQCSLRP